MTGQYIETFAVNVASNKFKLDIKTQIERKRVKRIQVFSPSNSLISENYFIAGNSTLRATNSQNPFFSDITNSLLWAYQYVKAEDRGLGLDFTDVPANGFDLVFEGTIDDDSSSAEGIIYVTLFYE